MIYLLAALAIVAAGVGGYGLGRRRQGLSAEAPELSAPAAAPDPKTSVVVSDRERRARTDIERALADLRLGVVVVDADGTETYRNNEAQKYATGRHGDALVQVALDRVLEAGLLGLSLEEGIEVYGPPARSILVQASPTYDGGDVAGAVGVIDDVTQARHTDRVRSDFVANVSHELRTPVGAMSVLAETIADSDDMEVIDRLSGRMQREANRLASTIDDLLALSRLESGPVLDPETIDLVSVASMALERTAEAAQQKQVVVDIDDEVGGPLLIDGDYGQLVSAVSNLIDNGIKYSDPGSEVQIRLRLVDSSSDSDADTSGDGRDGPTEEATNRPPSIDPTKRSPARWAELAVIDDGIGIPDRDLDRIFERFYRVDSARSRETGGTGLGLSIVRHALLNHGGTIDVESQEGAGSTFTVRLPLSPSHRQVESNRQEPVEPAMDSNGVTDVQ